MRSKFFVNEGRDFAAEFALAFVRKSAKGNRSEVGGGDKKVKSVEKIGGGFL